MDYVQYDSKFNVDNDRQEEGKYIRNDAMALLYFLVLLFLRFLIYGIA